MATAGAAHHSWQSRASVSVQTAPAPVVEYFAPAPAAPFAPAPGVHAEPAPVDEYVASAPLFEGRGPRTSSCTDRQGRAGSPGAGHRENRRDS